MQEKEREKKREKENTKRANGSKTRVKLKRRGKFGGRKSGCLLMKTMRVTSSVHNSAACTSGFSICDWPGCWSCDDGVLAVYWSDC